MSMPWRHRLRLLRRGLWYALALLLLAVALLVTVASQLLPLLQQHPQKIAAWLSARAHHPVAFDRVRTEWTRRGPLLRLDNLRVGEGAQPLVIGDAELLIAPYTGWLPGYSLTELRLRGLDLTLQRDANGQWHVRGLPGQQADTNPLDTLSQLGELQLEQARLRVLAPELGLDVNVPRIDLRLRVSGARVDAGARAWLRRAGQPLDVAGTLDRASGDGRVYAGSRQADLAELAGVLAWAGVAPQAGRGHVRVWATLKRLRVVAIRAVGELDGVTLRGTPLAPGQPAPVQGLGPVALDVAWAGTIENWRARALRLRVGQQQLDGLALAGGHGLALRAARLELAPLLEWAALSDLLPPALRRWLRAARPAGVLDDVQFAADGQGRLRARLRASGLRFAPVGHAPGLRGVGGWLLADQDGLRLRFDPGAQVVFDWPSGFGVPHAFTLGGEAVAWRNGSGWDVQTPGLAISGGPLQVRARGGIGFQGDGSRPHLDIAADLGQVPVTAARGFWVHYLMPKATVDWLDTALRGGVLREAHAVVAGDLDDWPFRDAPGLAGAGVFRVQTKVQDATVKFRPDWPAAEHLDADLAFVADGFQLQGRARLAGVPVTTLRASIPSFHQPELTVDAEAAGDAGQFLALLRASPLRKDNAATLDALAASGPAQASLHMRLPLHHDAPAPQLDGRVTLSGVRLLQRQYKLTFEQVRGTLRFDHDGFQADGLQVRHDGVPGLLSLRSGPHVRDPAQAFEAQLQTSADIDALLDRAGNLEWLKPYVRGSSAWTTELDVPRAAPGTARLRLQSALVGTRFDLPAPLDKPAAQALPASLQLSLPLEKGEVSVSLGDVLVLRSRSAGGQTGLRILLGGGAVGAPPVNGVLVEGRTPRLDALGWLGVLGSGHGEGPSLQRVDVQAAQLRLLGADFGDARLQLAPAAGGWAMQVQAPGLAGSLQVPQAHGAAVVGRFDRLYWTLPATEAEPLTTPTRDAVDPTNIPPLQIDVADLRLGGVPMGRARFRSTPVTGGMRMDEFSTSGSKQRLRGSGSWLGQGAAQRSQFRLDVDSDDAGALLGALGFGGQIGGGHGKLGLEASWRGGPQDFAPPNLDATLALDLKDGRLLELEPGAGRVLGLLGVAQLRRRLMLDFSDFFSKGFTFDRIQGNARIADGILHTDNLTIRGPAADILVRGDTDLRNQRFDQRVDVQPKSAGLLTAVGALAAGPVGAAVGAVANAVLDKPMRDIGAKHYRVTGPWSAPKIELLPRGEADAQAASASASD
ncbi:YhdP family protein [Thermomonas alba]|uniref:YhdP family protein n=1 Tax=Thermomonas alba TaxID=2888525 RepID=UPI001F04CDD2|nr:YhdP family protein [Thermomonas alba]